MKTAKVYPKQGFSHRLPQSFTFEKNCICKEFEIEMYS